MRYFLLYIHFFLLVLNGISQSPSQKIYTIKKDKVASVKSFNQIVPDFPKKIQWFSMEIMVNVGGKHGSKFFKGNDPNAINLSFLSQAKANSFVFISLKCRVESGEMIYKKYRIKITE